MSPDGSHAGHRRSVLITRPEPGASETAGHLAALGLVPVLAPMLTVRLLPVRLPAQVSAVLVTSGNAVPPLPPSLHGVPLLAVGDATAARAVAAGFTKVCSAGGDAVALAALAARSLPVGATVLLATGAGQGASLAAHLRADGFRVQRRTVYAARPVHALPEPARLALAGPDLRAVLFMSADTASAFVHALPTALRPSLAGVLALAIGQPAAEVVMHLPWRGVRVSAKPTMVSLMALL